jgi:hypothetical protein
MDFLSTTHRGRLRNVGGQDQTQIHDPRSFLDTEGLVAVDQGRTIAECPDLSTSQSFTDSDLNSSKLVSIDQACSVSAGIMWLSADDVERNHLSSQFFILLTGRFS